MCTKQSNDTDKQEDSEDDSKKKGGLYNFDGILLPNNLNLLLCHLSDLGSFTLQPKSSKFPHLHTEEYLVLKDYSGTSFQRILEHSSIHEVVLKNPGPTINAEYFVTLVLAIFSLFCGTRNQVYA